MFCAMTPFTGLIFGAFYLCTTAFFAEASSQKVPDCKKSVDNPIPLHHLREMLAVHVMVTKNQIPQNPASFL
ncbi:hypothetical protein ANCCAN_04174 [Ancylostoma caninum]|uniref:Secreted protein n=1 Tax=Ancylostoma caninum TaxID=29170 RepID=A0A368H1S5_ANCCA|nr:hypothetical protein ANCCAN_04174 [Ancylostoma caninum]